SPSDHASPWDRPGRRGLRSAAGADFTRGEVLGQLERDAGVPENAKIAVRSQNGCPNGEGIRGDEEAHRLDGSASSAHGEPEVTRLLPQTLRLLQDVASQKQRHDPATLSNRSET